MSAEVLISKRWEGSSKTKRVAVNKVAETTRNSCVIKTLPCYLFIFDRLSSPFFPLINLFKYIQCKLLKFYLLICILFTWIGKRVDAYFVDGNICMSWVFTTDRREEVVS